MSWPWILVIVAFLLLNGVASVRVLGASGAPSSVRLSQLALIRLLPVVGAVVCMAFHATYTPDDSTPLDRTAFANNADASGSPADPLAGSCLCGGAGSDSGDGGGGD